MVKFLIKFRLMYSYFCGEIYVRWISHRDDFRKINLNVYVILEYSNSMYINNLFEKLLNSIYYKFTSNWP